MITGKATLSCPVSAVTIKVAIEATESDHQREGAGAILANRSRRRHANVTERIYARRSKFKVQGSKFGTGNRAVRNLEL